MAKLARSPRRGRRELKLYALHVKKPSHRAPGGSGCVLSMLIRLQRRPLPPQHRLHVAAAEPLHETKKRRMVSGTDKRQ